MNECFFDGLEWLFYGFVVLVALEAIVSRYGRRF
jgi:hypothetical protein